MSNGSNNRFGIEMKKRKKGHQKQEMISDKELYEIYEVDTVFNFFIKSYGDDGESKKTMLCDLRNKTIPYLWDNLNVYKDFCIAIDKDQNGDSTPLMDIVMKLEGIFHHDVHSVAKDIMDKINSARALSGKNIDSKQKNDVLTQLNRFIDDSGKDAELSQFNQSGIIQEFWERNKDQCCELGWRKCDSLGRAFREYKNPTKKHIKQLSIFDKYTMLEDCKIIDFSSKEPDDNTNS